MRLGARAPLRLDRYGRGVSGEHSGHVHRVGESTDARRLSIALALIAGFMVAEIVAGILAHSLALLSDAAHMVTDAGALVMALVVIRLMRRPSGGNLTFGLRRSEILSAQANGGTLIVLAGLIVFGGIHRLVSPPDAEGLTILVVAVVGIGVNLLATRQLSQADRGSMNVEGSYQHVLADLIAFVVTAIAGAIIIATGWTRADG
ncbi:MAG: cation transporter, partial [Candidatus Rokuibacteriota bacterium]